MIAETLRLTKSIVHENVMEKFQTWEICDQNVCGSSNWLGSLQATSTIVQPQSDIAWSFSILSAKSCLKGNGFDSL